jgi:cephalosporin hydroxylase
MADAAYARPPLVFDGDDGLSIADVSFQLENKTHPRQPSDDVLFLHKGRKQIQIYQDFWEDRPKFQPQRILELGVWHGGSIAFWFEYFQPRKHVAVDILPARHLPALDQYLAGDVRRACISIYWDTDQADGDALRRIVTTTFHAPIDLIIDDASHLYGPTKASFETLFPLLRPGGLYLIEDWPWGYDARFRAPDHPWTGERALSDLVPALLEQTGTSMRIVRSVFVNAALIAVERGGMPAAALAGFRL